MKISVVIAAKNEELMIRDCISSVEFANEVIVVDDNSTDETSKIAKELITWRKSSKLENQGQ